MLFLLIFLFFWFYLVSRRGKWVEEKVGISIYGKIFGVRSFDGVVGFKGEVC